MRIASLLAAALLLAAGIASAAVQATDDAGARIVLAQPARRVVSLAPHLTEQLFAIGAGSRIVATTDFADYPEQARTLPRVARAHNVDLERVAAARPDLIVVWGSGFPPATLAALRRLGAPVYVDEPSSLDGIAASMLRLGELTAATDAERAATAFRASVQRLRSRYAERRQVSVFYQVWPQPLMTLGGRHVLSEGLRTCGARNIFEALEPIAPQVSVEAVLAADPQMIVTAEPGGVDRGALDVWKRFPRQRAVAGGHLVTVDADRINRHTPRLAEELAVLCERIDAVRQAGDAVKSRP
ncbi:MAG: cobalamin-binding protein [Burkholderiales bacterium]|nr:MAG: cobalamin-binding protein [Burkholderiales bacterium]